MVSERVNGMLSMHYRKQTFPVNGAFQSGKARSGIIRLPDLMLTIVF